MSQRKSGKSQKSRAILAQVAARSLLPIASKKQVRALARVEAAAVLNPRRAAPRPRRQRAAQGAGMNYMATDGLSRSRVHTNTSVIEDRFQVRREKIADIAGATAAFTAPQSLYINPGNSVLFPIFSQIAATYEEYRVNFLRFTFETEAYTASGTTQSAGIVCLATNFDPDDSAFSNLTQMENYCGSVKGPPYAPIIQHDVVKAHRLRRARRAGMADLSLNNYFVYSSANSAAPTNSTAKFYDIGLFQLAVANMVGSGIIGELYVEYSFTMIRPKQQTPLGQNLLTAHIVETPSATAAAAGSAFLGTGGGVVRGGSTIPIVTTASTFTLPVAGRFTVSAFWSGIVGAVPIFSLGANITAVNIISDSTTSTGSAVSTGKAAGLWTYDVAVSGTGAGNTVTISGLTSLANGTADIFISQVPGALLLQPSRAAGISTDLLEHVLRRLDEWDAKHNGGESSEDDPEDYCPIDHCGDPGHVTAGLNQLKQRELPPGDYVIHSDGSVVPRSGSVTRTTPKVSLSHSVLQAMGLP